MKYSPKDYARAFAEVADGTKTKDAEETLVKNFLRAVEKNGDAGQLKKIFEAAEEAVRKKHGLRKVTIETARPLPEAKKSLKEFLGVSDIVEEKTDPSLVAGMKITVNDEMQFDASLSRKLKKIFT
jgi:F0F1-type ATP synthase delta subunit